MAGRPLAVMSEMKVSQEDLAARAWAWRGVAAGKASRFRPNRALSRRAKTNGAVYATPGGSRHASITGLLKREERAVREEGVGAGHRARAGELGYGGGSQGVD